MKAGDICYVRQGIYHESVTLFNSGTKGMPITFQAYQQENVVLDGTKTIAPNWKPYKNGIYKTHVNIGKIEQLFANAEMMTEARWPNCSLDHIFERSKWAAVDKGSEHGKIVCDSIAKTGIDWTGAMAYLNVAHQWWTWNRPITKHTKGSNELFYDANLVGLCDNTPEYHDKKWLEERWGDDFFYLFGKLEALDVPTEWFFDEKNQDLYFYPPDGKKPQDLVVAYKESNYAFQSANQSFIELNGFNFFASTFLFDHCNNIKVSNCNLKYPTYSRTITEYDAERKESIITKIVGDSNTVDHISLGFANNMGLMIMGSDNMVTNSIFHDVNWSGTLIYPALQLSSSPDLGVNWFNTIQYPPTKRTIENSEVTSYGNVARNNTLFNCGNSLLVYHSAGSIVEYNHIYNGGKACKDVSLVYGCWPFSRGSEVRYNWVHGCSSDAKQAKEGSGGIGIRADDQSRNNRFHHNAIWDCGMAGIVAKGDDNLVYNNTIFDIKAAGKHTLSIVMDKGPEPTKIWAVQWPQLKAQNQWSKVYNNLTYNILGSHKVTDTLKVSENVFNNYSMEETDLPLVDKYNFDFRLKKGCELIDKGKALAKAKYNGAAPDIGAYEYGEPKWTAGAKWEESNEWVKMLLPALRKK